MQHLTFGIVLSLVSFDLAGVDILLEYHILSISLSFFVSFIIIPLSTTVHPSIISFSLFFLLFAINCLSFLFSSITSFFIFSSLDPSFFSALLPFSFQFFSNSFKKISFHFPFVYFFPLLYLLVGQTIGLAQLVSPIFSLSKYFLCFPAFQPSGVRVPAELIFSHALNLTSPTLFTFSRQILFTPGTFLFLTYFSLLMWHFLPLSWYFYSSFHLSLFTPMVVFLLLTWYFLLISWYFLRLTWYFLFRRVVLFTSLVFVYFNYLKNMSIF